MTLVLAGGMGVGTRTIIGVAFGVVTGKGTLLSYFAEGQAAIELNQCRWWWQWKWGCAFVDRSE